jgi:hypothetical protein
MWANVRTRQTRKLFIEGLETEIDAEPGCILAKKLPCRFDIFGRGFPNCNRTGVHVRSNEARSIPWKPLAFCVSGALCGIAGLAYHWRATEHRRS